MIKALYSKVICRDPLETKTELMISRGMSIRYDRTLSWAPPAIKAMRKSGWSRIAMSAFIIGESLRIHS